MPYFKDNFLTLSGIPFHEEALGRDFRRFANYLLQAQRTFFLYRNFQSLNIIVRDDALYGIDYYRGRQGALQYDIASLLYDAKADIPREVRGMLLEYYLEAVENYIPIDRDAFKQLYCGYVLIRIMHSLGTFGFHGFSEQKSHYLRSIPFAVQNLEWLLRHTTCPVDVPELLDVFYSIISSTRLRQYGNPSLRLIVRIMSFSYKRGAPRDERGHGGGFVFDCRSLPNPQRIPELASLTGSDQPVVAYLERLPEVSLFMSSMLAIVDQAIDNFRQRNFTDMMISFGCTGGKHRSVYCAEQLAEHIRETHHITVELEHRDIADPNA